MPDHFISFWNLENLFDVESSPTRPDWLQSRLAGELAGWTAQVLDKKLSQLAHIIKQMNGGAGPDILGVCEVENEVVLQKLVEKLDLPGRTYEVAHADTSDKRGIDVAFIVDSSLYQVGLQFQHFVQKRTATRDIFQVNTITSAGRHLVLVGNHWPSRSGGQYSSEPYRMMVGETLAYFHKRILEELGEDTAIVAMGDFNDEPFDRSVREYALAMRERQKIMNARSVDYFYNLMWEPTGERLASFYFGNQPNMLDQFWVSRGIVKTTGPFAVRPEDIDVFRPAELVAGGDYPNPRKFGRPSRSSSFDPDGFSDHFPIVMKLCEAGA